MGSLCRNGYGLAYPKCGISFRALALSLATIEPFYLLSDSSSSEIRLLATLLSVFLSQMQALSQGLWVLCAEMGMASMCGRGFRAVALCLAKIDPFYWPSDSYSTEIRLLAVLLPLFSRQMQVVSQRLWVLDAEMGVAWHILGAGEVSEP